MWIVLGPPDHGVVILAERLCAQASVAACSERVRATEVGELLHSSELHQALAGDGSVGPSVAVHFTDRLFGSDCAAAATAYSDLAELVSDHQGELSVTLHDLPMDVGDPDRFRRRAGAYRRVVAATSGRVIVSSAHEADQLGAIDPQAEAVVIPLPVDANQHATRPEDRQTVDVSILGFLYPGNGHAEVLEALPSLPAGTRLVALGRPADGHEAMVGELTRRAEELGRSFVLSGWIAAEELRSVLGQAGIPMLGPRRISASASISSWLWAGRRPLVPDVAYTRELIDRMPGALTLYPPTPQGMVDALGRAQAHPDSTWLSADVSLGPSLAEVAVAYLGAVRDRAHSASRW